MSKRKQNIINWEMLKAFFGYNPNKWIIGASTIILLSIYLYFLSIPKLIIFPNGNNYKFDFYTDSANGGGSKIISKAVTDSTIIFEFELNEGFLSPYVGLSIMPQKDSVINLFSYNLIHLDIEGKGINTIGVALYNRNPFKKFETSSSELSFYSNFEISKERNQYSINLNDLRLPDWLSDINKISPNEPARLDLKHIPNFTIGTAHTAIIGTRLLLKIYSISFERNNRNLVLLLITLELFVVLILVISYFFRANSEKTIAPVVISYKPVDVEKETQQLKSFLTYINANFHDNNLTLEQVSKQTGINQRRIANYIQQTFGCNFKTYVNNLKINESKRLLFESDLNVGEIAYKVGFINQSHFNRVFKNSTGINPSEFREMKK